ncbi:UDP-N-acetylenolpyruvoylglucosamine reductase [bacterium 1xD42-87]|nr:UDP-N-acetylenolpyruvoylglucosamine reductase [bacterium 1xD42-87]
MTALRREAIQLVEQMPEEQMPYVIQYIQSLKESVLDINLTLGEIEVSPKMKAFWDLEKMIVPISGELDYDKELAEARDEKYGCFD